MNISQPADVSCFKGVEAPIDKPYNPELDNTIQLSIELLSSYTSIALDLYHVKGSEDDNLQPPSLMKACYSYGLFEAPCEKES